MKAMILAAGLGTRLRPLTDDRPKALVEVAGHTMLEITLARLRAFGVSEVIINVHHFADKVIEFLAPPRNFGMRIEISREDILLDTGGGLKKAAWFFLEGEGQDEPFIVHNVDVISSIDLGRMVRFHTDQNALATLAVQARPTSRPLLFDDAGQFRGRATPGLSEYPGTHALAFAGIHVVSPRIFDKLTEEGVFSIIDSYVRLAGEHAKIIAFRADEYDWRDLGRPESIAQAERDAASGAV